MAQNPFFRLGDFSEIKLLAWDGLNTTSNLPVPSGFSMDVLGIEASGIKLLLPPRSVSTGHAFQFKLKLIRDETEEKLLHFTAKVTSVVDDERNRQEVQLSFQSFPKQDWAQFLFYMDKKRADLQNLIKISRK